MVNYHKIIKYFGFLIPFVITSNAHAATASEKPITISVATAFRSDDQFDPSTLALINGIQTAKALFEKENPRYIINLKKFDYKTDNLTSVIQTANKIAREKIPATIGGEMSEEAIALGNVLNENQLVFVTPTATNPAVTQNKNYVFRACFSDETVAKMLAKFVAKNLKPEEIGIIDNVSFPYTDYLTKAFIENYIQLTYKTPLVKKVIRQQVDFSSEINSFKEKNINTIIMLTYDVDLRRFYVQAASKNYFPIYIGSDGWGDNEGLIRVLNKETSVGDKFIGYRNYYWKDDLPTSINRKFKSYFIKLNHKQPDAWNAIGFDTAWLLFAAMKNAKNPNNSTQIQKQLKGIENIKLATTKGFSFNSKNSSNGDLYIYRVTSKGAKYIATINS